MFRAKAYHGSRGIRDEFALGLPVVHGILDLDEHEPESPPRDRGPRGRGPTGESPTGVSEDQAKLSGQRDAVAMGSAERVRT